MKASSTAGYSAFALLFCAILSRSAVAEERPTRLQSFALQAGWNAVWLEVDPLQKTPAEIFANAPVDIVARYFPTHTSVQFISDPGEQTWKTNDWHLWYRSDREDSFLTNLQQIQGGASYLIHATNAFNLTLTGEVKFRPYRWKSKSYNLFGFSVEPGLAAPTFSQYFDGSNGKIGAKIYRLVGGNWIRITSPQTERMREGEACWVYSDGKTDYQGPLNVEVSGLRGVDFGSLSTQSSVSIRNRGATSQLNLSVSGTLPLNETVTDLTDLSKSYPAVPAHQSLGLIDQGAVTKLVLQLRRDRMTADSQCALIKISNSDGAVVWVPVKGQKSNP